MDLEMYFRGYAKISLDAIYDNILALKSNINEHIEIAAVIKTDGYGHGAIPIAKAINNIISQYAVATVFEAKNLRDHGITKPIFLLGYTAECTYELAIENDIQMVVYTKQMAEAMSDCAVKMGKTVKINIALDTGMSRIGFLPGEETVEDIVYINSLANLKIEGVFTHFAKADEKDKTSAYKQLDIYKEMIGKIEDRGVEIPLKHCSNSAGSMEIPEAEFDMVRVGISIYGLYPSDEVEKERVKLTPAMSLYSHVIHVKTIEAGRGVSYGHTFIAEKEMQVATIPLGYGDGYFRNLSNKGHVIIKGHKVPIVGRVCMDQFMVDVTGLDIKIGDEVTLIGRDGNQEITVEELAAQAETFNYEFVCDLGKRIPRVYYRKGRIVGTKDYFSDKYEIDL